MSRWHQSLKSKSYCKNLTIKINNRIELNQIMTWNPKDDIYKQFAKTPEQRLIDWEEWIRIREHEVVKLGVRTIRPPVDLAMNIIETFRPKREWKITLEEAQIPVKPRLRGGLWEQPPRLRQACPCENEYEAHRTAAELAKPKIIEHVACPEYIQKHEKGLLDEKQRIICSKLNRTYDDYRKQKEDVYKNKIAKIDPFRPDMNELIVLGRRPETPPKKILTPTISLTPPQNDPCEESLRGVYALRINDTIAVKYIPNQNTKVLENMQKEHWHTNCTNWMYYFNVAENKIGRANMFLQNLGTVTLRYCWKKVKKVIPYVPEENDHNFFFNKNEDVIAPGQSKHIFFTFVANSPGIFSQTWELVLMNNILFDTTNDRFSITLVGDSIENIKKISRKIEKFENRLDRKVASKLVFNLMSTAITNATDVQHQIYPYKKYIVEAELFVAKNMQHFYHQTEVGLLKEAYKHMTGNEWDLSLLSWRNVMMQKEFEERMRYYDQVKKSNRILLAPWYEGEDLLYEKHRAVKLLLGQLALKFFDEFERVSEWNGVGHEKPTNKNDPKPISPLLKSPLTKHIVKNIFYIRMYDHVADTIETIAGIISSLELNRWIEFDFCQI